MSFLTQLFFNIDTSVKIYKNMAARIASLYNFMGAFNPEGASDVGDEFVTPSVQFPRTNWSLNKFASYKSINCSLDQDMMAADGSITIQQDGIYQVFLGVTCRKQCAQNIHIFDAHSCTSALMWSCCVRCVPDKADWRI